MRMSIKRRIVFTDSHRQKQDKNRLGDACVAQFCQRLLQPRNSNAGTNEHALLASILRAPSTFSESVLRTVVSDIRPPGSDFDHQDLDLSEPRPRLSQSSKPEILTEFS